MAGRVTNRDASRDCGRDSDLACHTRYIDLSQDGGQQGASRLCSILYRKKRGFEVWKSTLCVGSSLKVGRRPFRGLWPDGEQEWVFSSRLVARVCPERHPRSVAGMTGQIPQIRRSGSEREEER